jgi:hypothetical protein
MKKIFLLGILSLSLFSCDESNITFAPYDSVNDSQVLEKPADFTNVINGAYAYMIKRDGENGFGQELLIDSEVATDNLILNVQGRQSNKDGFRFTSTPSSSHFDFYNSAYKSVTFANLALSKLDKLSDGAFKDNIEGEARFIRAINHFELLRNYSKIPTQSADANASLGVSYYDVINPILKPSRLTVQESYDKVLADLIIAKDKIGDNVITNGHPGKAAVYALLSRVYLYMGQWQNCIDNANLAISHYSGDVATRAQFYTSATNGLWEDSNVAGVLFKVRIDVVDGITPGVAYSQAAGSQTKSEYCVSKEFYDKFQATDIRKAAYIKTGPFGTGSNLHIYNNISKYDGRGTGPKNVVDVKVLRLEEVYLNKAEAEYNLSGGGLASLDKIRSNRYSGFVSPNETGAALYAAIMLERRLELAFEMDRFYTLKRLNLPVVRSATDGHWADGTGTPAEFTNLPAGDFRWQFPIPQYERDINENLQQNPGY